MIAARPPRPCAKAAGSIDRAAHTPITDQNRFLIVPLAIYCLPSRPSPAGGAPPSGVKPRMLSPDELTILLMRPTGVPSREGARVIVTSAPGASAASERFLPQPSCCSCAGLGAISPLQCTTSPFSFFTSKKSCGCGLAYRNSTTVAFTEYALLWSYDTPVP